ncbi:MAG: hypothetical protein AAFY73_01410 [Pseudomonadota bacterium]
MAEQAIRNNQPDQFSNVIHATCFGQAVRQTSFSINDQEAMTLDRLRWLAMRASLKGKPQDGAVYWAPARMLALSLTELGEMFFSALSRHARHRMVMYRPGAAELSNDEIWLMRLLRTFRHGDLVQARRMIAWYIGGDMKPQVQALAENLARRLQTEVKATHTV